MPGKHWSNEEVKFLEENYGKIPALEIAEYLNRSFMSVTLKAFYFGLKAVPGNKWQPTYDESFFDIWSSDLAWLVGVMLSDGYVANANNGKYIWVKMCDKDVLDKIKIITGYKGNVNPLKREKPHYKKPYIITIGGKRI